MWYFYKILYLCNDADPVSLFICCYRYDTWRAGDGITIVNLPDFHGIFLRVWISIAHKLCSKAARNRTYNYGVRKVQRKVSLSHLYKAFSVITWFFEVNGRQARKYRHNAAMEYTHNITSDGSNETWPGNYTVNYRIKT